MIIRTFALVSLFFILSCLCAFVTEGERIVNVTNYTVKIVIHTRDGLIIEKKLAPHMTIGKRIDNLSDTGPQYHKMEAFDESDNVIGRLDVSSFTPKRKQYGNFITVLVTERGLYPVPIKYLDDPVAHVSEIIDKFNKAH